MLDHLQQGHEIKGECTLLVGGDKGNSDTSLASLMDELNQGLKKKDTTVSRLSKELARRHGIPKSAVYQKAVKIKKSDKSRNRTSGTGV
jgi:16S rRNA C1402 (ribose-2'-O) methylase RsmI